MQEASVKGLTPVVMVDNVKRTIEFYKDKLGFNIIVTVPQEGSEPLDFAILQHGGAMVMFQERNNLIEEYPELKKQSAGGFTLFIEVDDVDYIYNTIKDRSKIIKDVHTSFYGMKEFALEDCNGIILIFAQRQ